MNLCEPPASIPEAVGQGSHSPAHQSLIPQSKAREPSLRLSSKDRLLPHQETLPPALLGLGSASGCWTGLVPPGNQLHCAAWDQHPILLLAFSGMVLPLPDPENHGGRRNRPEHLSPSQVMAVGASRSTPKHTGLPVDTGHPLRSSRYLSLSTPPPSWLQAEDLRSSSSTRPCPAVTLDLLPVVFVSVHATQESMLSTQVTLTPVHTHVQTQCSGNPIVITLY